MAVSNNGHNSVLSVIIPAYNEEDGIVDIIQRVLAVEPELKEVGIAELELIVVDDGSSDRTAETVAQQANVRLIQHETNRGYGAALKTGFCSGKGEFLAFLDADGTYPPEYFPMLCKYALDGAQIVVGSRRSGDDSEMPRVRKVGNFIWSNLVSILGRQRVIDPASGMRVFRRDILERIYPLPDGLNLTPIMSTRAIHEGLTLVEVPIPYKERVGRSKLSVVRDGTLFLNSIIWTVLTYNPVRILGIIGLGLIALSALVALAILIARLSGITTLGPLGVTSLYVALVAAVAGISIFSLGVTFNYLVSLFFKRPVRQGLLSKPIFKTPLDRHFGWLGLLSLFSGLIIGVFAVILGSTGWSIDRLWFYLLGSAMLTLVGVQFIIYWILIRVLDELSQREVQVTHDMTANT